jgi:hypothetical protein
VSEEKKRTGGSVCDFCSEHVELKTDIKWIKRISIAIFLAVMIPLIVSGVNKAVKQLYADDAKPKIITGR